MIEVWPVGNLPEYFRRYQVCQLLEICPRTLDIRLGLAFRYVNRFQRTWMPLIKGKKRYITRYQFWVLKRIDERYKLFNCQHQEVEEWLKTEPLKDSDFLKWVNNNEINRNIA